MGSKRWLLVLLVLVAWVGRECSVASAAELEGFGDDEDDDEVGLYQPPPTPRGKPTASQQRAEAKQEDWQEGEVDEQPAGEGEGDSRSSEEFGRGKKAEDSGPKEPKYWEMLGGVVFVLYIITYFIGKKRNTDLVIAWAEEFCTEGGIFDRNFALLGPGNSEDEGNIIKESASEYKFYCSGRRFCEGLLATIDLAKRQDLISLVWGLLNPRDDTLSIDVYMNDKDMEPVIMYIGRRKLARSMHKDCGDLSTYTSLMDVPQPLRAAWPSEDISVLAEARDVLEDLITPELMNKVFGEPAWAAAKPWFESIHVTDRTEGASHGKQVRFRFRIPPKGRVKEMAPLIALVPYMIDLMGRYSLSSMQRARAEKVRKKEEELAFKATLGDRKDALAKKKEEQRAAAKEALSPAQLAKLEEKRLKKQNKARAGKMLIRR